MSHLPSHGWADYADATTSTTPIVLTPNSWTQLTNDGAGANTRTDYLPFGVSSLMHTPAGTLNLTELSRGDIIKVRNTFTITPNSNNARINLRYAMGLASPFYLDKDLGKLPNGSGQPTKFGLEIDIIYAGESDVRDNPVAIEVRSNKLASVVVSNTLISVIRKGF